jgi:hypothetical protein
MAIEVGGIQFTSKRRLEEYVRALLKSIGVCTSVRANNIEHYNFLIDLFRRHPRYPEKIYGITDISITSNIMRPQYLTTNIVRDSGVEDISWVNCVTGSGTDSFKSALRVAVTDQIITFRNSQQLICNTCGRTDEGEYHVDHIIHFEHLVCEFIQHTTLTQPALFDSGPDNRKQFRHNDKEYEDAWKTFHASHATLRILCRSCNLKRPKWNKIVSDKSPAT